MGRTIVFVHGAWVTPASWDPMLGFFRGRGYECHAPAWPGKEGSVGAVRANPSRLAGLGIGEIAAHYETFVRALPEPPILVGHSFGGLFVQLLLDRGLGAAGIAVDSAPPKGVFALEPSTLRAFGRILLNPFNAKGVARWSFEGFRWAFVHTLPPDEQRAAYDRCVVPESRRIFWQGAVAPMSRHSPMKLDFQRPGRAPLLLIAGTDDRTVPARVNRRNHAKYARSSSRTDFREFPGRVHWIIAQDGWQEVAEFMAGWLADVGAAPR